MNVTSSWSACALLLPLLLPAPQVATPATPPPTSAAPATAEPPRPAAPEPHRILWEDGVKNAYPHWSRDGARILFQSNRGGAWQIEVIDADGSHRQQLTQGPSNNNFPDWSPDNAWVAFVSDRDGDEDVFVMKSDGSGARHLTKNPARDIHPYWSQDGEKILFSSTRDTERFQLFEMDKDGGAVQRLVTSQDDDTCSRVSPTGDRIVYLTNLKSGHDDVIVARRDGSEPQNVTHDKRPDGWPCWTPDGRLVFAAGDYGAFSLLVMQADGTGQRRLTTPEPGLTDARPHVSPDGRRLVFNRERGETIGIFAVEL
jgi:Tol biopolymer transport system component